MFDKERKVISKLDEQIENNQYILYLNSKEYKTYKKLLSDFKDIFKLELPKVLEKKGQVNTINTFYGFDIPAPTYKGFPVKERP